MRRSDDLAGPAVMRLPALHPDVYGCHLLGCVFNRHHPQLREAALP